MSGQHDEAHPVKNPTRHSHCDDACCGFDLEAERERFALEGQPEDELLYDLADLFKVFSDTTRIKILFALMEHDLNVGEIADAIGASQSAVSHQLRTLKQARLVKFTRSGKTVTYSLSDDHVYVMLAQGLTHICE
ncbi:MAG: metalloregulator ArsR/SmtB family transcription factor [Coriobacteriia bacterium]|nr:metalloregulator ArsR/SmtB family transcription factor [Coriobacteriia bacterium]